VWGVVKKMRPVTAIENFINPDKADSILHYLIQPSLPIVALIIFLPTPYTPNPDYFVSVLSPPENQRSDFLYRMSYEEISPILISPAVPMLIVVLRSPTLTLFLSPLISPI